MTSKVAAKQFRKLDSDYKWLIELTNYEEMAMKMLEPVKVREIEPVLICCSGTGDAAKLWDYFRAVLSSATQSRSYGTGRALPWMLLDGKTNTFLGLFLFADMSPWPEINEYIGGRLSGIYPGTAKDGTPLLTTLPHLACIKRCLPTPEFGDLTGGKLLTLACMSQEPLRTYELKYGMAVSHVCVRALHGKASQYNRLDANGLKLLGVNEETDVATYVFDVRKKAAQFLRGEVQRMGKSNSKTLQHNWEFWKERWLSIRLSRLADGETLVVDKERLRLSLRLKEMRGRQLNNVFKRPNEVPHD